MSLGERAIRTMLEHHKRLFVAGCLLLVGVGSFVLWCLYPLLGCTTAPIEAAWIGPPYPDIQTICVKEYADHTLMAFQTNDPAVRVRDFYHASIQDAPWQLTKVDGQDGQLIFWAGNIPEQYAA